MFVALTALSLGGQVRASDPPTTTSPNDLEVPASDLATSVSATEREGAGIVLDGRWDDDAALPAHASKVHDTVLRAKLDPTTHVIEGTEEIVFHSPADEPVKELSFHLYLNAFKNERSEFLRGQLGVGRGGALPADWGHIDLDELTLLDDGSGEGPTNLLPRARMVAAVAEDETDLEVPLPRPLPPRGTLKLRLKFRSKLPTVVERTGYLGSFHLAGQWFPKLSRLTAKGRWEHFAFHRFTEFAADFGRYDATIDVPKGFVVGATGKRLDHRDEGDRSIDRYVQDDVHDFAFTAWDKFQEQTTVVDGVSVRQLFPASHDRAVKIELDALRGALPCYGRRFGRYPYETLTVVRPPDGAEEAGGMEYPTLITTGGHWSGPPVVRLSEVLAVHEFGHQHFFGLLASNEQRSPFLDEGLNSYAEDLCLAEMYGPANALRAPFLEIDSAEAHRSRALGVGLDHPIGGSAPSFPTSRHYSGLVYARTATLLHTLRRVYGEEAFDRALGRYARAYRFRHPTPADLLDAIAQGIGPDAAENARLALFERGSVDYVATHLVSVKEHSPSGVFDREAGKRETVAGTQTGAWTGSVVVVRRGKLAFPIDVRLSFADGASRTVRWSGREDWVRIPVASTSELVRAEVDPERRVLLDERRDNDAIGKRTHRVAPRVWETSAFLLGLVELLAAP